MATFTTTVLCFLALAHPCMGASLTAVKTMRREDRVEVNLNERAQVARTDADVTTATAAPGAEVDHTGFNHNNGTVFAHGAGRNASNYVHILKRNLARFCPKAEGDFCGCHYPESTQANSQDGCTDNSKQDAFPDAGMCMHAAKVAGVHTEAQHFYVTSADHPIGCYKTNCVVDSSRQCYRYNELGDVSMYKGAATGAVQITGTPVCSWDKYVNGTAFDGTGALLVQLGRSRSDTVTDAPTTVTDAPTTVADAATTVAAHSAGCPPGYSVIDTESRCEKAAECLPYCQGGAFSDSFLIGSRNASRHLDYPLGCFINTKGSSTAEPEMMRAGCVYFNPTTDATSHPVSTETDANGGSVQLGGGMGDPTHPHGTPLCMAD